MTPNPMLELLPGQQIQAWPELYNLTLDASPGQQQSRGRIQLNMLDTAELGGTDEGSLYLYLPSELFSEQELMALRRMIQRPGACSIPIWNSTAVTCDWPATLWR